MSSAKKIKRFLNKIINAVCKRRSEFVVNPLNDFTRQGKLPLELCVKTVLSFTSKSFGGEMVDFSAASRICLLFPHFISG